MLVNLVVAVGVAKLASANYVHLGSLILDRSYDPLIVSYKFRLYLHPLMRSHALPPTWVYFLSE